MADVGVVPLTVAHVAEALGGWSRVAWGRVPDGVGAGDLFGLAILDLVGDAAGEVRIRNLTQRETVSVLGVPFVGDSSGTQVAFEGVRSGDLLSVEIRPLPGSSRCWLVSGDGTTGASLAVSTTALDAVGSAVSDFPTFAITTQPESITLTDGGASDDITWATDAPVTAVMQVYTYGTWVAGAAVADGVSTQTITIPASADNNGLVYRWLLSDGVTSQFTDEASVTVGQSSALAFSSTPDATETVDQADSLSWVFSGGIPTFSVEVLVNGTPSSWVQSTRNVDVAFPAAGEFEVTVTVFDASQSVVSNTTTVTVTEDIASPEFTAAPASTVSVAEGSDVPLYWTASANTTVVVRRDGLLVASGPEGAAVDVSGYAPGDHTLTATATNTSNGLQAITSTTLTIFQPENTTGDASIAGFSLTAGGGTSLSITLPEEAVIGHRALLVVSSSSSADPTAATATGWTSAGSFYSTSGSPTFSPRITLLEKVLTSGDIAAGSVTVAHNVNAASAVDIVCFVIEGESVGTIQVSDGTSVFDTTVTAPTFTAANDSIVITVFAAREALLSWTSFPTSTLLSTDTSDGGDNHILIAASIADEDDEVTPGSVTMVSNGTSGILNAISFAIPVGVAAVVTPPTPTEADLLESDETVLPLGALTFTQLNTAFLPFTGASIRTQDNTAYGISAVADPGVPSGRAIRYASLKANTVPNQPLHYSAYYFSGGPSSTVNEAYTSAWLYFESGFDFRLGGKLPIGIAGGNPIPHGGVNPRNGAGFGVRAMFRGTAYGPPRDCLEGYTYSMDSATYGSEYRFERDMGTSKSSTNGNPIGITTGRWYHVGLGVNLGTGSTGSNRGWIKLYLDGELVRTVPNVAFKTTASQHYINTAYMWYFHGGNTAAWTPTRDSYIRVGGYKWTTTPALAGLPT